MSRREAGAGDLVGRPYAVVRDAGVARLALPLLLLALLLAGCGGEPTRGFDIAAAPEPTAALPPLSLPRDEAPHGYLTEWWYYTGHLEAEGRAYGFELVMFQSVRARLPKLYVAHFAITDHARKRFRYDQRTQIGGQPAQRRGFELRVGQWRMSGYDGRDRLRAAMPGYALDLALAATKPPLLHGGSGLLSFGAAGSSYYYSRTRMDVRGTLTVDGKRLPATGQAWMDHQWGDFISVAGGGWDWYSVQLEDGADIVLNVVKDVESGARVRYGEYVAPDGAATHLGPEAFSTTPTGSWRSPRTGIVYPSGWRVRLPGRRLALDLLPVIPDQELDTRESTGVIYWEGAVAVRGTRDGRPVRGRGYVELTGYGPDAAESPSPSRRESGPGAPDGRGERR